MVKVPFKVSARTARLIGRENVATPKGAVIELVKNGYDADSRYSIVYIDNKYSVFHELLSVEQYIALQNVGIELSLLEEIYIKKGEEYVAENSTNPGIPLLIEQQKKNAKLYIIDCGEGMSRDIIENYWMTIGTDNKSNNFITPNGRIKAGAKGIGRFALDKLGERCEMLTFFDVNVHNCKDEDSAFKGYRWNVNWNDFEGVDKTIDHVDAELEGISTTYIENIELLNIPDSIKDLLKVSKATHGTILKISGLRDIWDEEAVAQLYDDLGVLVPPIENQDYSIVLKDSLEPQKYGVIESAFCDDYDYKIEAHADSEQKVQITVYRNEYDVESIPPSFFRRKNQQKQNYTKADFLRGYWTIERTFAELIPGYRDKDVTHTFENIGAFDFTFFFMKRTASKKDEKRFFYKHCSYNLRAEWLNKFGGIKLFRDRFRVRPYGERNNSAFDWLGLGARKQKSPAGIAKLDGGYKVEVENVAGSIFISRLTNIDFEDKSSREGLQENQTFSVFKLLIQGIISIFEEDRATIARELAADDYDRNGDAQNQEKAEKLAKAIMEKQSNSSLTDEDRQNPHYQSMALLAALNEQKNLEIEQLREEQKVLRALASSGLMLASFSHDLSKLNNSMNGRFEKIKSLFLANLPIDTFEGYEDRKNPYALLDLAMQTDEKMQNWLNFSIGIIKKDKRRRKDIILESYFRTLKLTWASIFESRAIRCNVTGVEKLKIRAFEIDFDSIFYNLFSNSIEAFTRMKEERERTIDINFKRTDDSIICEYHDSGPGLSPDIVNPEIIMTPLFTTKRNKSTGEEVGTGLGMWIVKLVVEDNDGRINILNPEQGFGMNIIFSLKNFK